MKPRGRLNITASHTPGNRDVPSSQHIFSCSAREQTNFYPRFIKLFLYFALTLGPVARYHAKVRLLLLPGRPLACTHTGLAATRPEHIYLLYIRHHVVARSQHNGGQYRGYDWSDSPHIPGFLDCARRRNTQDYDCNSFTTRGHLASGFNMLKDWLIKKVENPVDTKLDTPFMFCMHCEMFDDSISHTYVIISSLNSLYHSKRLFSVKVL